MLDGKETVVKPDEFRETVQEDEVDEEKLIETDFTKEGEVPQTLINRDEQLKEIEDSVTSQFKQITYIYGPPGTGKSSTVKWFKDVRQWGTGEKNKKAVYINCRHNPSKRGLFKALHQEFGVKYKLNQKATENLDRMSEKLDSSELDEIVVFIDEFGNIVPSRNDSSTLDEVLTAFYKARMVPEEIDLNTFLIFNRDDLQDQMEDDMGKSRLSATKTIYFNRYKATELREIAKQYQSEYFTEEVLSESALGHLATRVEERMDSKGRVLLRALQEVVEMTNPEELQSNQIDEKELVEEAFSEAQYHNIHNQYTRNIDLKEAVLLRSMIFAVRATKNNEFDREWRTVKRIEKVFNEFLDFCGEPNFGNKPNPKDSRNAYVRNKLSEWMRTDFVRGRKNTDLNYNPMEYTLDVDLRPLRRSVEREMRRSGVLVQFYRSWDYSDHPVPVEPTQEYNYDLETTELVNESSDTYISSFREEDEQEEEPSEEEPQQQKETQEEPSETPTDDVDLEKEMAKLQAANRSAQEGEAQ